MTTEKIYTDFMQIRTKTTDILLTSNEIKSIHPLTYLTEMKDLDKKIIANIKGTGFFFKTQMFFYFITAKHNFNEYGLDLTEESIINKLHNLFLTKNYHSEEKKTLTNIKDNVINFDYLQFENSEEFDFCIFKINSDSINEEYFFEKFTHDESTQDGGFLIGYPIELQCVTDSLEITTQCCVMYLYNMRLENTATGNELIYTYDNYKEVPKKLSGFSGAPIVHYTPSKNKFTLFGMCISVGENKIRAIPINIIEKFIKDYEMNDN